MTRTKQKVFILVQYGANDSDVSRIIQVYATEGAALIRKERLEGRQKLSKPRSTYHVLEKSVQGSVDLGFVGINFIQVHEVEHK